MKRVSVKIYGRVQGVFFRANTKERAEKLGVKGWVKNNPDGSVSAVFEGPDKSVDKIVDSCKHGHDYAEVTNIEVNEELYKGEFKDFKIIY